jgi:hypothetical protein
VSTDSDDLEDELALNLLAVKALVCSAMIHTQRWVLSEDLGAGNCLLAKGLGALKGLLCVFLRTTSGLIGTMQLIENAE